MAAIDIAAQVRETALAAIEAQCFGEDFGFDCALSVRQMPGGAIITVYTLVTTLRSPLLGQPPLVNVGQIQSPQPAKETVEQVITEAIRGLREYARGLLANQN